MNPLPGAGPASSRRVDWRRAAAFGILFGIACTALESFGLPLGDMAVGDLLRFALVVLPVWSFTGVALAVAAMLFEHRSRAGLVAVAAAFALFALPSVALWVTTMPHVTAEGILLRNDGPSLHVWWGGVVYGSLFLVAYRLHLRSERTRRLLGEAEIAREQTDSAQATARLQVLQGHVDPAFILRVMGEVERRYVVAPHGADRLLDTLVSFLRAAMPGVRSGLSTLAAELELIRHYGAVRAELEPDRPPLRLSVDGPVPDVQFPALLLLPVLDRLALDDDGAAHVGLEVAADGRRCTLRLERSPSIDRAWLPPELHYRLRVGLAAMFGQDWALAVGAGLGTPTLTLTLPLWRVADAPLPLSTPQEMSHA